MNRWLAELLTAVLLVSVPATALAGRTCQEQAVAPEATAKAFDAALHVREWLDKAKPKVALLARRGQDLRAYQLTYSHVGFVMQDGQGNWVVVHDLNTCGSDKASLYEDGLAEFFADDLFSMEAAVVVPTADVQAALLAKLTREERFRMHESHYSAVAYPYALTYQNSNGWVLETFVRAVSSLPVDSREQAQALLKVLKYEPSVLTLNAFKRLGGRMFKANIAFDDHPGELRWSDRITVNTGDSLLRFMSRWAAQPVDCAASALGSGVCVLSTP